MVAQIDSISYEGSKIKWNVEDETIAKDALLLKIAGNLVGIS